MTTGLHATALIYYKLVSNSKERQVYLKKGISMSVMRSIYFVAIAFIGRADMTNESRV